MVRFLFILGIQLNQKYKPKFLNWMVQKTAKAVIIFQFSFDTIELTQRNRFNGFQHNPFIINK